MSFGDYEVRIDPWQAEYGSELPLELVSEQGAEGVDLTVEAAEADWTPRSAKQGAELGVFAFVDGVRRLEARILATRGGKRPFHGAFGTIAAGSVLIRNVEAKLGDVDLRRACVLGCGEKLPTAVEINDRLIYEAGSTPLEDAD